MKFRFSLKAAKLLWAVLCLFFLFVTFPLTIYATTTVAVMALLTCLFSLLPELSSSGRRWRFNTIFFVISVVEGVVFAPMAPHLFGAMVIDGGSVRPARLFESPFITQIRPSPKQWGDQVVLSLLAMDGDHPCVRRLECRYRVLEASPERFAVTGLDLSAVMKIVRDQIRNSLYATSPDLNLSPLRRELEQDVMQRCNETLAALGIEIAWLALLSQEMSLYDFANQR